MIQINIHYKLNELNLIVWTYSMKEEMRQSNGFVSNYRFLKEFTFYMTYDRISNIALFSSTGSIKMNLKRFNSMLNGWIFVSNLNTRCQIRYIQSIHHQVENPPLCFMDTIALVLDCFLFNISNKWHKRRHRIDSKNFSHFTNKFGVTVFVHTRDINIFYWLLAQECDRIRCLNWNGIE